MAGSALGKVVIIGDTLVGKTSIITAIRKRPFNSTEAPTVGAGSYLIERTISGMLSSIDMWDTAGQDAFASLVPYYTHDAKGAIFVFSVADEVSFNSIPDWVALVQERDKVPVRVLVGNKSDVPRVVSLDDASARAESLRLRYFETSAKTGSGIEDLVTEIFTELAQLPRNQSTVDVVQIDAGKTGNDTEECC
jgi:small GTP-binding protein